MSDALTSFTKLVNSPPGVLVAGGVLAGIVWKFFERVESVLKDDTKLEIGPGFQSNSLDASLRPYENS
jgi:hypothetical protein